MIVLYTRREKHGDEPVFLMHKLELDIGLCAPDAGVKFVATECGVGPQSYRVCVGYPIAPQ
jgi:hypothetical protein